MALFVALCLLASVLAPAASGQSQQTSWHVNDNPSLNGPSRYWWAGDAGKGYGSNNYVYTYGTAGESSAGNWARWSMGKRVGRQEIQAYVPNTRATATVLYRIDIGGTERTKRVAQNNAYGWTSLGAYDTDGDTVTITLRDNEATQHWNRHGKSKSSIGVDAIRMRCISSCSTASEVIVVPIPIQGPDADEPSAPRSLRVTADEDSATASWSAPSDDGGAAITGYRADLYRGNTRVDSKNLTASQRSAAFTGLSADTAYQIRVSAENSAGRSDRATASFRTDAAPQRQAARSVRIALAADRAGCGDTSKPCRWLSASYSGFAPGTYRVRCYRSTSPNSLGTQFTSFTTSRASGTNPALCWFNGTPGRHLTAVVDGVQSNTIQFTGTPPTPQTTAPGAPRIVGFVNAADTVGVVWGPPSDNGGAPITGYTIDLYLNNRRIDTKTLGAQTRETEFKNLSADTAYQVRITARNTAGTSNPTVANTRTGAATSAPSAPRNIRVTPDENSATASWNPPSNDGGAAITGYRADLYRNNTRVNRKSLSASQRSTTFAGLSADTAYQIRVSAENTAGRSASTAAGFRTDPARQPQASAPGAPRIVGFVNGADTVGVVWSPPSDNGGAPITGYTIDLYLNNRRIDTKTVGAQTRETEFKGLSADTAYQIRLTARNTAGTSNPTVANARTARATSAPSAPRNLRVSADEDSATVSWNPPSNDGGAAITGYRADLYRNNTRVNRKNLSASQRSTTFTGLSADTAYQIRVSAENSAGRSASAATGFRTHPASTRQESGLPSEPRSVRVTAGENRATVSWSAPASNGNNPLTGYQAELFRGGTFITRKHLSASQRSTSFTNLSADTAYQVLVSARNNQGLSTPTAAGFTTDAPEDTRSVTITLGADRANCQDTSKPCRWLSAQFSGFTPARHNAHCYYSTTPRTLGTRFWSGTVDTTTGNDPTLCWINATPGLHLTAVIDGVQSNTIQLAGTPPTAPGAPRNVRAVPVNSDQIKVTWDPPANSGSSPITHYTVNFSRPPSSFSQTARVSATAGNTYTYPANKLRQNTVYTIKVTAINQTGLPSPASTTTARTTFANTRASAPGAPRSLRVTPGEDSATVSWSPPSGDGGAAITGYRAELYRGPTRVERKNLSASQQSATFAGLSADTPYQVRIQAQNAAGTSTHTTTTFRTHTATQIFANARPGIGAPSAPRSLKVSADEDSATVSWSPPASNGGNSLTGYQVELFLYGGLITSKTLATSNRSTSFTNLSADTTYLVLVSAQNNLGLSTPTAIDFTTDALDETRSVTISLGADRANCQNTSKPCRWISASFSGFTPGRHNAKCYYSTSPKSLGTRFWSGTADTTPATDPTLCWLNGTPGLHLTAVIDGVQSNTIQLAGTVTSRPLFETLTPTLQVHLVDGRDSNSYKEDLSISWNPIEDGGNPISNYELCISRDPVTVGPDKRASSFQRCYTYTRDTKFTFDAIQCGTYTIILRGNNGKEWSKYTHTSIYTGGNCNSPNPNLRTIETNLKFEEYCSNCLQQQQKVDGIIVTWEIPKYSIYGDKKPDFKYEIEWGYVEFNMTKLGEQYKKLEGNITDQQRSSILYEIDNLLKGFPVGIDGSSTSRKWTQPFGCRAELPYKVYSGQGHAIFNSYSTDPLSLSRGLIACPRPDWECKYDTKEGTTTCGNHEYCKYNILSDYLLSYSCGDSKEETVLGQSTLSIKSPFFVIEGHDCADNRRLRVRIRYFIENLPTPLVPPKEVGQWSDWTHAYTNCGQQKNNIACTAVRGYNILKNIKDLFNVLNWGVTFISILLAAKSAGLTVAAAQGAREVITKAFPFFVKTFIMQHVKSRALKQIFRTLLVEFGKNQLETEAQSITKHIFGCLDSVMDLTPEELEALGTEIFSQLYEENRTGINWNNVSKNIGYAFGSTFYGSSR
ncbi:fibronectin type III domain-containing protein [Candidatus Poriferisocius sp.]|uniref:fibronectin type III domain-containing protein n=1 Tax=Candidatus Poriferisocius sp. TaxID=3101276 RepID=UPI003B5B7316